MEWMHWLVIGMLVADLTLNICVQYCLKKHWKISFTPVKDDGVYCMNTKCKMHRLTDFGCSLKMQLIGEDGKCAYHEKGEIIQ